MTMSQNAGRIEEATENRLVIISRSGRPLWQAMLLAIVLLPILVLLLVFSVSAFIGIFTAPDYIVSFMVWGILAASVLMLLCRILPKKRSVAFDKTRGTLEVKRNLLIPAKVISLALPDLVGVAYVKTHMGDRRAALVEFIGGWLLRLASGASKERHKLVMLTKVDDGYEATALHTLYGRLDDRDMDIVRRIGEFLETKAVTEGRAFSDADAFRMFSGEELGPKIAVEDFARRS